jgi:alcohol dehydrogenase, propanol-preferring
MKTYKVAVATAPGVLEIQERPVPLPGVGQVLIRVEACGVCHSDSATIEGTAGMGFPRVPGHEVVGRIESVGDGVTGWVTGDRVGVGFLGGEDGTCPSCRKGDFVSCDNPVISGMTVDGGYAEVMIAEARGLVAIPDALDAAEAAPLLCAGLTTFNALRNSGARPGDLVAILGVGGLGHLGVQFARWMGFRTVAIARGDDKAGLARKLGAHHYIDTATQDAAEELNKLGGAAAIIGTAPSGKAMSDVIPGLAPRGKIMVIAVSPDPVSADTTTLVFGGRHIQGTLTGTVVDNEEGLAFAELQGIKPMVEIFPLGEAVEAYKRMMHADVRFRAVLVTKAYVPGTQTVRVTSPSLSA